MTASLPLTDIHIHARAYRASGAVPELTVAAIAAHCREAGYAAIGVVDHCNQAPNYGPACVGALARAARELPRDVPLLAAGAELDILDGHGRLSGEADLKEQLGLDYVIASVHSRNLTPPDGGLAECIAAETEWMSAAMRDNPVSDVLGHPWAISRGRAGWSFEAVPVECRDRLLDALRRGGKAVSFDHRFVDLLDVPAFRAFVERLVDAGVKIAPASDAHSLDRIEISQRITAWLASIGLRREHLWWPWPC